MPTQSVRPRTRQRQQACLIRPTAAGVLLLAASLALLLSQAAAQSDNSTQAPKSVIFVPDSILPKAQTSGTGAADPAGSSAPTSPANSPADSDNNSSPSDSSSSSTGRAVEVSLDTTRDKTLEAVAQIEQQQADRNGTIPPGSQVTVDVNSTDPAALPTVVESAQGAQSIRELGTATPSVVSDS